MCDNSRECAAARIQGFGGAQTRRPIEDVPRATADGPMPVSVRPGWSESGFVRIVAVPCERGEDLESERSAHFGRAPAFGLVRLEADQIAAWWIAPNPSHDQPGHGPVASMLIDEGVTDVVTAGIGAGMYQRLVGAGVRLWREQDAATVAAAIEALVEGRAVPIAEADLHEGRGA